MEGAHLAILISLATQINGAVADHPFSSVESARAFLATRLDNTRLAAKWPCFKSFLGVLQLIPLIQFHTYAG